MAISPYSTAAQQGESYSSLRFDTKAAEDYLSGAEQASYTAATRGLGLEPKRGRGGKLKHPRKEYAAHQQAADKIKRLRDVASARAFDQYTASLGDYSKPWKVQAGPGGLISASDIRDTMDTGGTRSFGSMDILAGKKMRETLSSMVAGNERSLLDPNLIGSQSQRGQNAFTLGAIGEGNSTLRGRFATGQQSRVGASGAAGGAASAMKSRRLKYQLGQARSKGEVLDPERVYTGMGGFDLRSRAPDFGF